MRYLKGSIKNALVLVLSAGLFACGGSSGGGGPKVEKGVLLDAPVSGVHFKTATQESDTNSAGEYQFTEGEDVTFSIGDIQFPTVRAAGVVTPLDMAGTTDLKNPTAINILRLLQTLDSDGNPDNGIQISPEVVTAAKGASVNFAQSDADFAASVATFLTKVPGTPALVSSVKAQAHFETSLLTQMSGNYSGTFSGDDSGTWQITIDTSGKITGTGESTLEPGKSSLSGEVLADGSTTIGVVDNGSGSFTGTIKLTGEISGTWSDAPDSGTFTGKKDSPLLAFNAASIPGTYNVIDDDLPGVTHVYVFNADGTGVADWGDDPDNDTFTWSVDAAGRLIVNLSSLSGLPDEMTLISGTPENGRISARFDDDGISGYEGGALASFVKVTGGGSGGGTTVAQMAGNYSGTFSGDDSGTWQMTINVSGDITGTVNSNSESGSFPLSGTATSGGSTAFGIVDGDGSFSGAITLTGEISGTWSTSDESGAFSGQKDGPLLAFNAVSIPGTYNVIDDDLPGVTHVYVFNADGTGVADWGDDPIDEGFTWSVDDQGRLIVHLSNNSGLPDEYTLISGTPENGRISARIDDDDISGYEGGALASFVKVSGGVS